MNKNQCIFCGNPVENKTKEHVLPKWLIELTGDPKRQVNLYFDYETLEHKKFSWNKFTFPACENCNNNFSSLENSSKLIVQKLLSRKSIPANNFVTLLDWLDKVRTGLWLGYNYLNKNLVDIRPNFHIDNRIAIKDRAVAVYTIDTDEQGLNSFGAESILFQYMPCVFGLKINNTLLFNLSWDFMCSARCGFPYPKQYYLDIDDNRHYIKDIQISEKIKHPIIRRSIIKPSIFLYQPIIPLEIIERFKDNNFINNQLINTREGKLIRQFSDHIEVIDEPDDLIMFDEVKEIDSKPLYEIINQVFDFQNYSSTFISTRSKDINQRREIEKVFKFARDINKRRIIKYRQQCKNRKSYVNR